MSLERVYPSKLYRVNKNKDSIKSAFENPINSQLLQQLFNQVDDKYKKLDDVKNDDVKPETSKYDDPQVDNADEKSENSSSHDNSNINRHFSSPMNFESMSNVDDSMEDADKDFDDATENDIPDDVSDNAPDDNDSDVAESTKICRKSVEAAKALYTNTEKTHDFKADCDVIKGTLNSRQDTTGVIRTTVKDNEMWLYYNDSINLNNVMAQVIEVLSNAGYNYLEFNRLARSDNAIVFEINPDTAQEVSKEYEKE